LAREVVTARLKTAERLDIQQFHVLNYPSFSRTFHSMMTLQWNSAATWLGTYVSAVKTATESSQASHQLWRISRMWFALEFSSQQNL
jgi:hypothetical protein